MKEKNTLDFEVKSTVVVYVDELADELERDIPTILIDYQGIDDNDELEAIDFDAVKKAVARKWLGE